MNWTKCIPECRPEQIDRDFYRALKNIENETGIKLTITSAYRPYDWEIKKGRSGTSSHVKGLAVDIHVNNSRERALIIRAAFNNNVRRIGLYKTFLHLDVDYTKPNPCMFWGN